MPEGKNNQLVAGHTIVDVVSGAREIEPPNVRVTTRTAPSANARLLRKHLESFSQVQADGIWSRGSVVGPPHCGPFDLS